MFKYLFSIFLLLRSSLWVAHAATLDCTSPNDDNNNHHYENDSEAATASSSSSSSCRLNLSYKEIANAISGSSNNQGTSPQLDCQPGKDGIECTFHSTAIENNKYKNNKNNNPVVVSHVKPIFDEICASLVSSSSSGEEEKKNAYYFCIGSKWATRWSMQNTGDVAAEAISGAEATETDKNQPQRQQQHQEKLRGEETAKRETEAQVLATEGGGGGFSIRVGNHYYNEPFDEYHESVANVLKAQAHLWKKTLSSQGDDVAHEYSIGNAQMDIGIAHYSTVINSDEGMEEEATGTGSEALDLKLAVNAFQEAETTYQHILGKYEHERHVLHSSLGGLYLQWGEVYQSPHFDLDDDDEDSEQAHQSLNELSLFYYGKSETHYRLCIETGKNFHTEEFIRDTETNLAHVLHRMGRSLVSSVSGVPATASMLYEDVASSGSTTTATAAANSQIQKLMTAIPKAEKKFQQAVALYRKAIDSEKDFARQVELQNHLCTALLDAGNGVAYASDYAKAISLQEEGLDICQDLLQHLSGGNYQYMLQYIGESMYGVANHYMMLGKYDATSASYQAAMDWFEHYHLQPAANIIAYDVPDESLEAYEKQLEDYLQLKTEISIPDGYVDEYSVQYRPNPAYEGGLHGALGAIHLSRNEILMAIEHFNEAILLYENFDGEENLDRSIADCKTSLAAAYFQNGEYRKSAEAHCDAMETYKAVVGEGKNPLLEGLLEKLGAFGETGDLGSADLSEILGSDVVQELLASLDAGDLTATIERLAKATGEEEHVTTTDSNDHKGESTGEEKSGDKKAVHQELFDIENLRQMLLNATSMQGEL